MADTFCTTAATTALTPVSAALAKLITSGPWAFTVYEYIVEIVAEVSAKLVEFLPTSVAIGVTEPSRNTRYPSAPSTAFHDTKILLVHTLSVATTDVGASMARCPLSRLKLELENLESLTVANTL